MRGFFFVSSLAQAAPDDPERELLSRILKSWNERLGEKVATWPVASDLHCEPG